MDIRLNKSSEVPLWHQIAEQVLFQITIEKLKPGQNLPSVRELARRLKVHHNTVSQAYQDLARRQWVKMQRGKRMTILAKEEPLQNSDDLINLMIGLARGRGFDLRELAEKIQERLLADRPDHLLVVGEEVGLRKLIQMELSQALHWPVVTCSLEDLQAANNLLLGAQVVTPLIYHERVTALAPKGRPILPIRYQNANEHIERIRQLAEPSFIAVVSISERILLTARSLFTPAIGHRHSMQEFLLPLESPDVLKQRMS